MATVRFVGKKQMRQKATALVTAVAGAVSELDDHADNMSNGLDRFTRNRLRHTSNTLDELSKALDAELDADDRTLNLHAIGQWVNLTVSTATAAISLAAAVITLEATTTAADAAVQCQAELPGAYSPRPRFPTEDDYREITDEPSDDDFDNAIAHGESLPTIGPTKGTVRFSPLLQTLLSTTDRQDLAEQVVNSEVSPLEAREHIAQLTDREPERINVTNDQGATRFSLLAPGDPRVRTADPTPPDTPS